MVKNVHEILVNGDLKDPLQIIKNTINALNYKEEKDE